MKTMHIRYKTYQKQKGIALIMVLLVVALVSIIATGIASKQNISTKRTYNLLNYEQAYMQLLGAEDWAKTILIADADPKNDDNDNKATEDSLNDIWNRGLDGTVGGEIKLPIENGVLTGKIDDLQSRFNINNVFNSENQTPNEKQLLLVKNLFKAINTREKDANFPIQTDGIVDWMDSNLDALPYGGEDGEYLSKPIPYVAANRPMVSASELIKTVGFNFAQYEMIASSLTALPELTPININTADEMQFRMLIENISDTDIKTILEARGDNGFSNVSDFTDLKEVPDNLEPVLMALRSNYFLLRTRAVVGSSQAEMYSILHRVSESNSPTVVNVLLRSQRRI